MIAGKTVQSRKTQALVLLLSPITILLGAFFLIPLGIMVVYSFLEPGLYGGVEWNWYPYNYGRIIGWPLNDYETFEPIYLSIFLSSLKIACLTVICSLLICYPAAFWVSRMSERRKSFVLFLITLPFFANLLVRIYAWLLLLRPTGFINMALQSIGLVAQPLDMLFSSFAVIVGMVYIFTPFMFLPIYANVEKMDYSLVRASQDLGATPLQTFLRVILPLTLPGIAGGSIIVFIPALGNFIVPSFLGGSKVQMTGNLIERSFLQSRDWPFGAALALLIMASVVLVVMFQVVRSSRAQTRGAA
ncbi:ABC transporter permease [Pseudorhizobium flavum]|uniref:Spermidine/putrescine transport system permease protein n=1 Tax=Pseudorhizobium flavum TaxID=1335061 RepID=A0A7W9Z313_9HYPH|nr:ABC transporter permease [Pseudorhizobium flavum]MBB6182236.1 spermidine/putrescine transport system permease protein [Pseudorhizobium flavum]CAD6629375.1 ABC transporter permease [Pseudorhizobium flavum]